MLNNTARSILIKKGVAIEAVSLLWMVAEAVVALWAGIQARSLALTAFGADSVIELAAGAAVFWRLLVELRGKSGERLEKAEKAASLFVGVSLLLLALYIVVSAVLGLIGRTEAEESTPGIILAAAAGITMPLLALAKRKVGRAIGSEALTADGMCSMVCAWMSWILLLGLAMNSFFHIWWADSAISLVFVYFVVKEGLEAIRESRENEGRT